MALPILEKIKKAGQSVLGSIMPTPKPTSASEAIAQGYKQTPIAPPQVNAVNPAISTTAPTPSPKIDPITPPQTAREAIDSGYKQSVQAPQPVQENQNTPTQTSIAPTTQVVASDKINPLSKSYQESISTEVGREKALWQLPNTNFTSQNPEQIKALDEQNKVSKSGEQLWKNMESISAMSPNLLGDRASFDMAFWYAGKDEGEKRMVDAYWQSKQPKPLTSEDIFATLQSGGQIGESEKKTEAYMSAMKRKQDLQRNMNMTGDQLSRSIISGTMIRWTQAYDDLAKYNPKLISDAEKLTNFNTPVTMMDTEKVIAEKEKNTGSAMMEIVKNLATDQRALSEVAQSPEMQQYRSDQVEAKRAMEELKTARGNMKKDYYSLYAGQPKSFIEAKIAEDSDLLTDQYNNALAKYDSAGQAMTSILEQANNDYKNKVALSQVAMDAVQYEEWKVASANKSAVEQKRWEYEQALKADEQSWNKESFYAGKQFDLVKQANDQTFTGQENQLNRENQIGMKQYEVQAEQIRDANQFERDKYLKSMDIQATDNRAEADWQRSVALEGLKSDNSLKATALSKLIEQGYTPAEAIAMVSWDGSATQGTLESTSPGKIGQKLARGQCGEFANDWNAKLGSDVWYDDSFESKAKTVTDQTPLVGGDAIFYTGTKYGHVGKVIGVNQEKGTITVRDSNWWNDEKVQEREIPIKWGGIVGYNNTPASAYQQKQSSIEAAKPKKALEWYGYAKVADDQLYRENLIWPDKAAVMGNTRKALESYGQLAYNYKRLVDMVNKHGTELYDFWWETEQMKAIHTDIIMNLKEVYGLGAPQIGDLALLDKAIESPEKRFMKGSTYLKILKTQMDTQINAINTKAWGIGIQLQDFYKLAGTK